MNESFPYKFPEVLPRVFQDISSYWNDLCRGQAEMPFTDVINLTELSEEENDLIILAGPHCHRSNYVWPPYVWRVMVSLEHPRMSCHRAYRS